MGTRLGRSIDCFSICLFGDETTKWTGGWGYLISGMCPAVPLKGGRGRGTVFLLISARMLLIVFGLRHAISVRFCVFEVILPLGTMLNSSCLPLCALGIFWKANSDKYVSVAFRMSYVDFGADGY